MLSKKNLANYLPIILVILLAFLLRFIWIDKVPNAVGGDELTYIVNARAMFLTGTDISGIWSPLSAFAFILPLVEIFNTHNYTPLLQEDLIPV